MDAQVDPRLALATIAITASVALAQKIMALIHTNKDDDAELAAVVTDMEARIARRS